MGKRKITCNNASCKHHISGGGCDTCIMLDGSGKCKSFEKGFAYYFHIVWDALGDKNFIDMIEVQRNPDLRIGMYYVMECYELGFSEMEWGTCRMLMLKNGENGEPLNYEGITARELNMEKFRKLMGVRVALPIPFVFRNRNITKFKIRIGYSFVLKIN